MTSPYKLLPQSADHVQIAQIVRECVRKMRAHKLSYRKIADHVTVRRQKHGGGAALTEASLKTFMSRDLNRVNSNNMTLEILYNYLFEEMHRLEADVRSVVMAQWSVFNPSLATEEADAQKTRRRLSHDISALLCKWILDSDPSHMPMARKIAGSYVMLRKSVHNKDVIVKSAVTITIDPDDHAVEVRHVHADRQGVPRLSDGIVVPVKPNIYCIMQIETGQGMEILALKEPIQDKFRRLMGFLLSFNIDRKLLSARVFLERMTKEWEAAPPRFEVEALERFSPSLRDHIKPKLLLLDHGTAHTLSDEVLDAAARAFMTVPPALAPGD